MAESFGVNGYACSCECAAGDVFRERLILALADGRTKPDHDVAADVSADHLALVEAALRARMNDGLGPRHKGSQPRVAAAVLQARIARKTRQKPAAGSTHSLCRKMAEALG